MTSKGYSKEEIDQLPEFYVSVAVDEEPIVWMKPIADPFVHQFVVINWWDRFKSIFKREFKIQVSITGNNAAVLNTLVAKHYSRLHFSRIWNAGKEIKGGESLGSGGDSRN